MIGLGLAALVATALLVCMKHEKQNESAMDVAWKTWKSQYAKSYGGAQETMRKDIFV